MELLQKLLAVLKVFLGFPGIVFLGVPFPLDKVLTPLFLQDPFDFELVVLLRLEMECCLERGVGVCWFQERYMKYWVDSCILWQFQSVVKIASFLSDQKRSDLHVIQLLASSLGFQILCEKVDLIPLLKQRCRF